MTKVEITITASRLINGRIFYKSHKITDIELMCSSFGIEGCYRYYRNLCKQELDNIEKKMEAKP